MCEKVEMTLAPRVHSFSSGTTMGEVRSLQRWHMLPREESTSKRPTVCGLHLFGVLHLSPIRIHGKTKSFTSKTVPGQTMQIPTLTGLYYFRKAFSNYQTHKLNRQKFCDNSVFLTSGWRVCNIAAGRNPRIPCKYSPNILGFEQLGN